MSKINVDEIKVGDLVETMYGQERWLCYVTKLDIKNERYKGIWSDNFKEEWDCMDDITGHWKVINFEEETKMDELKVYTGKETLQALLEGKTLKHNQTGYLYKFNESGLKGKLGDKEWSSSFILADLLFKEEFTEVATPQVGDWVRITTHLGNTRTGQANDIKGNAMKAVWSDNNLDSWITLGHDGWTYEILSPEQVSEYKREQVFAKVGRKPNEYKHGDIVYIDALAVVATVITKNNGMEEIKLHGINEAGKGYTARAHQLTPIFFTENIVDLT